ncbi:hypothetical protein M3Y97_00395200 [Aphelenchoides bicaudatus]|nr:hypothetical protein M3Y97_00395200 [Aphelenchoides bicaudatus]
MIEDLRANINFLPRYDFDTMKLCTDEFVRLHALNTEIFKQNLSSGTPSQEAVTLANMRGQIMERLKALLLRLPQ